LMLAMFINDRKIVTWYMGVGTRVVTRGCCDGNIFVVISVHTYSCVPALITGRSHIT